MIQMRITALLSSPLPVKIKVRFLTRRNYQKLQLQEITNLKKVREILEGLFNTQVSQFEMNYRNK